MEGYMCVCDGGEQGAGVCGTEGAWVQVYVQEPTMQVQR